MKANLLRFGLLCLFTVTVNAADGKGKRLAQLPPAVRQAVLALVGDGRLNDIERATEHGQPVFEGEFRRDGVVRNFTLAADGMLISKQVFEKELPTPVDQTLRTQLADAQLGELYWMNDDGDPAYFAEITRGGVKSSLTIAPDGWLIGRQLLLAELPAAVRVGVQKWLNGAAAIRIERADDGEEVTFEVTVEAGGRTRLGIFDDDGTLTAGDVSYAEVPSAALKTIKERLRNNRLIHIFRSEEDGVTFCEAIFVRGNLKYSVTVRADGELVTAQIPPGEAPAPVQKALRDQNAFLVRLEQNFGVGEGTFDALLRANGKAIRLELKADGTAK
ncbi:MAG: hypothetical protein EB141_10255 [Verrucomicrobia bacterium]|nr:hypothetical protein [Verrucomicrobiota bacterium]NBU08061.1 hypothetical protein [Pseudomonadota bacterium]NDB76008.1 hypothetical protein [Verrucomicrobiota bacterium]